MPGHYGKMHKKTGSKKPTAKEKARAKDAKTGIMRKRKKG